MNTANAVRAMVSSGITAEPVDCFTPPISQRRLVGLPIQAFAPKIYGRRNAGD